VEDLQESHDSSEFLEGLAEESSQPTLSSSPLPDPLPPLSPPLNQRTNRVLAEKSSQIQPDFHQLSPDSSSGMEVKSAL
jgi:hypothetical protein